MPAIWTGTVVQWEETQEADKKEKDENKPEVASKRRRHKPIKFVDLKYISVYYPDENTESSAVVPLIIADFIKLKKDQKLWEAYGKGLLQVYNVERTLVVTPPRIPLDDE